MKGGSDMPNTVPIRNFENTSAILQMCLNTSEPICVTQEGYGDMVVMSRKIYEEKMFMQDVYNNLAESEADFAAGRTIDAFESLKRIREKHNV
jgi:PHD/YefM family antitoxin component YafN of YafNO toxin-antitoxin module